MLSAPFCVATPPLPRHYDLLSHAFAPAFSARTNYRDAQVYGLISFRPLPDLPHVRGLGFLCLALALFAADTGERERNVRRCGRSVRKRILPGLRVALV